MKYSHQAVLETALDWLEQGHSVELVTVVRTWGSSPRPPGSIAAVRNDGLLSGSVSGGCVEKQLAEQFRASDRPRVHTHHVDDQQAKRYGLACGGELELLFETLTSPESIEPVVAQLANRCRVVRRVRLDTGDVAVSEADRTDVFDWSEPEMLQVFGPGWKLMIVGAGELSLFTAQFAQALDFEVVVVDPRPEFRKAWAMSEVDVLDMSPDDAVLELANDARSAVLALSHDPNIDDLALLEALPGEPFYVGALGSTRNYEKRCKRLAGLDVPQVSIERLRGPVGLSIGARTSAEIAISIVAELIQVRKALL